MTNRKLIQQLKDESECLEAMIDTDTIFDTIDSAISALEAMEWQDIETAPKDGTVFDVWLGNADKVDVDFYCTAGSKRSAGWCWRNGKFRPHLPSSISIVTVVEPTHWMPLPTLPETE